MAYNFCVVRRIVVYSLFLDMVMEFIILSTGPYYITNMTDDTEDITNR
jgi:hypothetical protein